MNINKEVGQQVRGRLRKARKWTLKDLSMRIGISLAFLSQMERGERRWTIQRLSQVAPELGMTPGMILDATIQQAQQKEAVK